MDAPQTIRCTAFDHEQLIASGELAQVAQALRQRPAASGDALRVYDDATGEQLTLDLRGSHAEVVQRQTAGLDPAQPRGPRSRGRPRLGVVAREITLLPTQWEWLNAQPGGASVTLRRLVDGARQLQRGMDRQRRAQEVTYRFLHGMAKALPEYEQALRALYAIDRPRFEQVLATWPQDLAGHARRLAQDVFAPIE